MGKNYLFTYKKALEELNEALYKIENKEKYFSSFDFAKMLKGLHKQDILTWFEIMLETFSDDLDREIKISSMRECIEFKIEEINEEIANKGLYKKIVVYTYIDNRLYTELSEEETAKGNYTEIQRYFEDETLYIQVEYNR